MNEIPYLGRFRVDNFFVPYSLEQVTNDTNNIFLERSIPTQTVFAADREVGFAFYNSSQDERLTWSTGCFIDSISEGFKKRLDDNQGYRVSGRLTWLPYDNDQPKARWSHLDMNPLQAGQYDDLTVGVNWYWSDRTRWMFDWIHPITTEQTLYGATESDLLAMRFDFNW
jgi:phosphate-selective porin OprO/OprP